MNRWTIAAIRQANIDGAQFFFSRATMKFFKQTMKDFGVYHRGERVFIREKNRGLYREFDPDTGHISVPLRLDQCREFGLPVRYRQRGDDIEFLP